MGVLMELFDTSITTHTQRVKHAAARVPVRRTRRFTADWSVSVHYGDNMCTQYDANVMVRHSRFPAVYRITLQ